MATGATVILCDVEGSGPLVDTASFDRLRALNFGVGALRDPLTPAALTAELHRYDAREAAAVAARVRAECGIERATDRLLALYAELRAEAPSLTGADHDTACLAAASRYLQATSSRVVAQEREIARRGEALAAQERHIAHLGDTLTTLETSPFGRLRRGLLRLPVLASLYRHLRRGGGGPSTDRREDDRSPTS
jgi:hypothetical protein